MNRIAVAGVAFTFGIAGCHTSSAHRARAVDPSVLVAQAAALHTPVGNRTATNIEVERLDLSPVPPGAERTSQVPASLAAPALGMAMSPSLIDVHRYWRVERPLDAVWAYLKAQVPAGLQREGGSISAGSATSVTSVALLWSEPSQGYATNLQLEVSVARAMKGQGTVIRADAMALWVDPRPLRDTASGARMHISTAGTCPPSDKSMVGVTSAGSDLTKRLLPDSAPSAGLICEYGGLNSSPRFSLHRSVRLPAAVAGHVADEYSALPTGHADSGPHSCSMDDLSIDIIVFSYPGRADVDLWVKANGCAAVSNGVIVVIGRPYLGHGVATH